MLPDNLSQLVAKYIVCIRPFARVLDMRESEYLFADEHGSWAVEQLSRELANETTKHLGVRLTVGAWRHVAIGIAVQWLGSGSKMWEKDEESGEENVAGSSSSSVRCRRNTKLDGSEPQVMFHVPIIDPISRPRQSG